MILRKQKMIGAITALLLTQLAACSSSSNDNGPADTSGSVDIGVNTGSTLSWTTCENASSRYECAKIEVPIDYSQPDAEKIDIALIRLPATGSARLGSLAFMFGGPAPYTEQVPIFDRFGSIPNSVKSSFDIIGFDVRGLGDSSPVDCFQIGDGGVHPYPINAEQITQMHADYSQMATECIAKEGDYLQHLGSLNVVRDMEQMRIALGDEKLNIFASSFGTRFGALYLQEYPQSSGRIILDATINPDSSQRGFYVDVMKTREAGVLAALSTCKESDPSCDPAELLNKLSERANTLAAEDTEDSRFELVVLERIVFERILENTEDAANYLPSLIEYINTSDTSAVEAQIMALDDGELLDPVEFDAMDRALNCADDPARPDVPALVATLDEFNQESDFFAETSLSFSSQCAGWPESIAPLAIIATSTAPQSLVIGGSNDFLAPIVWSEAMATQVGGYLIRSGHDGHSGPFIGKSECLDELVAKFLLDGLTPATQECL